MYYGYARVSSQHQVDSGLSLGAQDDQFKRHFAFIKPTYPDLEWGGVYSEKGESAYSKSFIKRRTGGKMHQSLKRGDHIAFSRLDRAFRNLQDMLAMTELWSSMGIVVHYLDIGVDTSTAVGELIFHVLGVIAQFESRLRGERVRAAINRKKAMMVPRNLVPGRIVHGIEYRDGNLTGMYNMVTQKEHLVIARWCLWRRRAHGLGYVRLTRRLHEIMCERKGEYRANNEFQRWYPERMVEKLLNRAYRIWPPGVGGWGQRLSEEPAAAGGD